jgi:hypothetical protein
VYQSVPNKVPKSGIRVPNTARHPFGSIMCFEVGTQGDVSSTASQKTPPVVTSALVQTPAPPQLCDAVRVGFGLIIGWRSIKYPPTTNQHSSACRGQRRAHEDVFLCHVAGCHVIYIDHHERHTVQYDVPRGRTRSRKANRMRRTYRDGAATASS